MNHRAVARLMVIPMRLILEPGHSCRSGDSGAVNQHRSVEVTLREHLGDVVEVTPDPIAAPGMQPDRQPYDAEQPKPSTASITI